MPRAARSSLLFFTFLTGWLLPPFAASAAAESSSSHAPAAPAPALPAGADAAELVRDAPLYPPLKDPPDLDLDPLEGEHSYNELETSIEESSILVTPEDSTRLIKTDDVTDIQRGEGGLEEEEGGRTKRSNEWDKTSKSSGARRVQTGATILNIRGAVRDAIGDAGAAPPRAGTGVGAASRLDAVVIRPAGARATHPHRDPARAQPPAAQVPRKERELLVMAHSRARIPCDLTNVTNLRWYKDSEQLSVSSWSPSGGGGEAVWREAGALVVARATRSDVAAWRCAGADRAGNTLSGKPTYLLIYEPVRSVYLAVDGRRLDAGNTWVPVRDKTVLEVRCVAEGGVPPPELTWRLTALEPALDHRPYLRIHPTNYSIEGVSSSLVVVTAARELHNATLQCAARQRRPAAPSAAPAGGSTPPPAQLDDEQAAKLEIHVTYPPSFVISRWPGFGVSLVAGGAAALRCDVDANPPARAAWLRDDAHTSSSPAPPEDAPEPAGAATLRWPALRGAHAGWYRCRATWLHAEYSSIGYYLNVLSPDDEAENATAPMPEPEQPEQPEHQRVEVPLGGSVQLHCPKGSVGCWWRRAGGGAGVGAGGDMGGGAAAWAPAGSHHAHGVLGIKDALYEEGGEYRCVGARAPDLQRLRELKRVTLKVTGGATATAVSAEPAGGGWRLECGACGRGVRVLWVRAAAGAAPATPVPAALSPDLAQHCWRAVLHVTEPDEVWCVAVTSSSGAVAVFPARRPLPSHSDVTHASPAPARHSVRALHNSADLVLPSPLLLLYLLFSK